jgi:type VI secretion system protein ImpL
VGAELLKREPWVVPLGPDEQTNDIPKHLQILAGAYATRYIEQWRDWMADLQVRIPANLKEARELYTELAKPDYPYLRVLRYLEDHTQWKRDRGTLNLGRLSTVPDEFKRTVEFGVPSIAGGAAPVTDTPLAKYISLLNALRDEIQKLEDRNPNADATQLSDKLIDAVREAEALLQPFDGRAKALLRPLLINPLLVVAARLPPLSAISRVPNPIGGGPLR